MTAASTQLCTFTVAGLTIGVDVLRVQEVMKAQRMTRVPKAPPLIKGLINLRGQIVTAIDLRYRFGLPPVEDGRELMHVVIRDDDATVSFLVDEIGDVLDVEANAYEAPPATTAQSLRNLLLGVVRLEGRILLVMDATKILEDSGDSLPDADTYSSWSDGESPK